MIGFDENNEGIININDEDVAQHEIAAANAKPINHKILFFILVNYY